MRLRCMSYIDSDLLVSYVYRGLQKTTTHVAFGGCVGPDGTVGAGLPILSYLSQWNYQWHYGNSSRCLMEGFKGCLRMQGISPRTTNTQKSCVDVLVRRKISRKEYKCSPQAGEVRLARVRCFMTHLPENSLHLSLHPSYCKSLLNKPYRTTCLLLTYT